MPRLRANVDVNQALIVRALRGVGATVWHTHQLGRGAPDLIAGYRGRNYALEIKAGKDKLTPLEAEWTLRWKGQVAIVRTIPEALAAIGAVEPLEAAGKER